MTRFKGVFVGLALACLSGGAFAQEKPSPTRLTNDHYFELERIGEAQISPDGTRIIYTRQVVNKAADKWEPTLWLINADGSQDRFLAKGSAPRWSPDGKRVLYMGEADGGSQIFVQWLDLQGPPTQLTHETEKVGDAEWSPDGSTIAFTMFVGDAPKWSISMPATPKDAKWTPPPRIVDTLHYRQDRVGFLDSGYTHLFVISADGGAARQLTRGKWSLGSGELRGPVPLSFSPDGKSLVVEASRDFNQDAVDERSQILVVDVATGAARELFATPGAWSRPIVSPDGRTVAFKGHPSSDKSYPPSELYLVPFEGGALRKISADFDREPGTIVWAPDSSGVYFDADDQGARNVDFASVKGGVVPVTTGRHMLSLDSLSRDGKAVGAFSDPDHPAEIASFDLHRKSPLKLLTHVNAAMLEGKTLGKTQEITWTSSGGVSVMGWYIVPPGFDPAKKYPLILEIHGGPYGNYNLGFNYMWQNFAANDFVVLYLNPRGSTGYGKAFSDGIDHNYPGPDYDDLMSGVDAVLAKGFIDTQRMYVSGCSGGGVLSSWVIGHTDRFAAAAVRCPVTDWIGLTGHSDIPFLAYRLFKKPFWEDPSDWLSHSSLMHVGKVTTPTLLMTGVLDRRTPMPQTEEYFAALKVRGVPTTLLQFEGEYHGTASKPSNFIRTQLYMMSWFKRYARGVDGKVIQAPAETPKAEDKAP